MLWLWYIAMLAYMVAMLTFLFDDFYAGWDKRPMAEYLRVYGIIDVVIFRRPRASGNGFECGTGGHVRLLHPGMD